MADTPPGAAAPQPPVPNPPWPPAPSTRETQPSAPLPPPGVSMAAGTAPRPGFTWRRVLVMAGVVLLIASCAVLVLLEIGQEGGVASLLVGIGAAVLPVPVLVACFMWLDRYEPEPVKYLAFCFSWGAAVSTYAALQVNRFAGEEGLPIPLVGVLVAPFIEELTKALGPALLLVFRRREWSGITDGIVYCGLSAVGFAMVENILYFGLHGYAEGVDQYGPATGAQNVFGIFILRVLISGFAHPLFTSMTGIGLGIAARSASRPIRIIVPLAGLLLAMILHGTWNLAATLSQLFAEPLILLYSYVGLMVPIFLGMVGLAVWLRSWEGRLTQRRLPDYVRAGWLTPPELAALATLGGRHAARRWARRVAGDEGLKAMRLFQISATRLALLRDGMVRGLDRKPAQLARTLDEERRLLDAIQTTRRVFVWRDPQTPVGIWDGTRYHLTFPDGIRRSVLAPAEPVVPIPVLLVPQPRPLTPAAPGYGPPPRPYGGTPGPYGGAPGPYGGTPGSGTGPGGVWPGPYPR